MLYYAYVFRLAVFRLSSGQEAAMTRRTQQMGEFLREEVTDIIRSEIDDPRLGFWTVTRVEVPPDLRTARVYVSVLGSDDERKETITALRGAAELHPRPPQTAHAHPYHSRSRFPRRPLHGARRGDRPDAEGAEARRVTGEGGDGVRVTRRRSPGRRPFPDTRYPTPVTPVKETA